MQASHIFKKETDWAETWYRGAGIRFPGYNEIIELTMRLTDKHSSASWMVFNSLIYMFDLSVVMGRYIYYFVGTVFNYTCIVLSKIIYRPVVIETGRAMKSPCPCSHYIDTPTLFCKFPKKKWSLAYIW